MATEPEQTQEAPKKIRPIASKRFFETYEEARAEFDATVKKLGKKRKVRLRRRAVGFDVVVWEAD